MPVAGFEGVYEVSNQGQVRGVRRRGSKGGVLRPYRNRSGYAVVSLRLPGRVTKVLVHRLVLQAFVGPPPPDAETRHLNGDQLDNKHGNHHYARRTHCPQGHPFDKHNTHIRKTNVGSGSARICRTCAAAESRHRRQFRDAGLPAELDINAEETTCESES